MNLKTINYRSRNIIDAEIRALGALIERREQWLNNPSNKNKGTYAAVSQDTAQMKQKLDELKAELKQLNVGVKA